MLLPRLPNRLLLRSRRQTLRLGVVAVVLQYAGGAFGLFVADVGGDFADQVGEKGAFGFGDVVFQCAGDVVEAVGGVFDDADAV